MRRWLVVIGGVLALAACSDEAASPPIVTDTNADTTTDAADDSGSDVADAGPDAGAETDATPDAVDDVPTTPASFCPPWPAPEGATVTVGPGGDLAGAVSGAASGTTILLEDGVYDVSAGPIWLKTPGVTLRSASGDRDAVVLDGGYADNGSGEVLGIAASDVAIVSITIRKARYHAIHATGSDDGDITGTVIYDVVVLDPAEQGVKVNPSGAKHYVDGGLLACSHLELTPAGRLEVQSHTSSGSTCYTGGIDAHAARDWIVRDNVVTGFWCDTDLSEHGIHFWRGSRDTMVERNLLIDNARAIGFGLTLGGGRTYADGPCGGAGERDHYGGIVRNNVIFGTDPALFASPSGMDGGIAFAYACDATAIHNTIVAAEAPFATIEWRFAETTATVVNNLATHAFRERNGATAVREGNLEDADPALVEDGAGHLAASASAAIDAGATGYEALCPEDVDGKLRDASPDVGADERSR